MANLFDGSRLFEVLQEAGLLPQYSAIPSGYFDPNANRMTGTKPSTVTHELTHAVQHNLLMDAARKIQDKAWNRKEITSQEKQFLTAMQKMYGESFGKVGQINSKQNEENLKVLKNQIQQMYKPVGDSKYDAYRTSRKELEAFGTGESSTLNPTDQDMPHLNPTMATEFDILLSLYQSLPKNIRQEFTSQRQSDVKEMRQKGYGDPKLDVLTFEDLTSNPFSRTIK